MLIHCPNTYKTQKLCDGAVQDCLIVLKFIPDWFVTSKMIEKFHDIFLANDDILFFNEDFSKFGEIYFNLVKLFGGEMGILSVDLDKINHDEKKLMKMILKLLFMSDFWLGIINLKNAKHFKKLRANN